MVGFICTDYTDCLYLEEGHLVHCLLGTGSGGGECVLCAPHGGRLTSVGVQVVKGLRFLWGLTEVRGGVRMVGV